MSVKIMGLVWDCGLPRAQKYVLLALADHADHDGRNIYPSYGRVAWKTGYDERHVIRITQELEQKKILVKQGVGPNGTNIWAIDLSKLPGRPDYGEQDGEKTSAGGVKMSPPGDTLPPPRGDILTPGVAECHPQDDILPSGGDISDKNLFKMSPESSFNRPLKPSVNRLNGGAIDILIPGAKVTPKRAWEIVASALQSEVPKAAVDYIRGLEPAGFDDERSLLILQAPTEYARDWVESRLRSSITRYLIGVCNRDMNVAFVTPTAGD